MRLFFHWQQNVNKKVKRKISISKWFPPYCVLYKYLHLVYMKLRSHSAGEPFSYNFRQIPIVKSINSQAKIYTLQTLRSSFIVKPVVKILLFITWQWTAVTACQSQVCTSWPSSISNRVLIFTRIISDDLGHHTNLLLLFGCVSCHIICFWPLLNIGKTFNCFMGKHEETCPQ